MSLPDLELTSTSNRRVNLSKVSSPRVVIYRMTGQDDIPGALTTAADPIERRR